MNENMWAGSMILPRPYYSKLLKSAAQYITVKEYAVSVIISFMACEVLAEQIFIELHSAFQTAPQPNGPREGFLSYNLANDKVLRRYVLLSGDKIQNQPFWPAFKKLATLRNAIVHGQQRTTGADDAVRAYNAAAALASHLVTITYGIPVTIPVAGADPIEGDTISTS